MAAKKSNKHGVLFKLKAPLKVTAYRGKFRLFEASKYFDLRALRTAKRKVAIECGTIEAGGHSFTIAAEIKGGEIVALRPLACAECHSRKSKPRKVSSETLKRTMLAVKEELERRKIPSPRFPQRLRSSARLISIPLGPIVITIGDFPEDGWDACITVYIPGFNICWCCIFSGCRCYDTGTL
jgi:hypothetical protein